MASLSPGLAKAARTWKRLAVLECSEWKTLFGFSRKTWRWPRMRGKARLYLRNSSEALTRK
jgi:hypothetical protein